MGVVAPGEEEERSLDFKINSILLWKLKNYIHMCRCFWKHGVRRWRLTLFLEK